MIKQVGRRLPADFIRLNRSVEDPLLNQFVDRLPVLDAVLEVRKQPTAAFAFESDDLVSYTAIEVRQGPGEFAQHGAHGVNASLISANEAGCLTPTSHV